MSKAIVTQGVKEWIEVITERFGVENTTLQVTEEAFTIMLDTSITANRNVWVGRYCRRTGMGMFRDRRDKQREN